MSDPHSTTTSATLLGRLCQESPNAADWGEFVKRYGPLIYGWCRRWKLQEADAEDVTQNVLVKLAAKLRTFRYDPSRSFRAYAKTLTHYAWCDYLESLRQPGGAGAGDQEIVDQLDQVAARDELQERLCDAFDREILDAAMERVRLRVDPRTWEAFRLSALEGLSGAETAARVGIGIAAAFQAKSRIQRMLREDVQRFQEELVQP
jgi:RNA polymerase sigma-70 factor (ECF subfamily)